MLGGFKVSRFDIEIRNAQFGAWKYSEKFRYSDDVEYQLYDLLFVWPCISDTLVEKNQLDATITIY